MRKHLLSLTGAERLVVTEAVERIHRAGRNRAECYRAAIRTLRALFPGMAMKVIAIEALAIVLDYVQSIG
jgi:hypothetical protein